MATPDDTRWLRRQRLLDAIRCDSFAAQKTTTRSAEVFSTTDTVPNTKNWMTTCPKETFTNCGMNERKNRAVFGFSISVQTPCRNACPRGLISAAGSSFRERIMPMPIHTRYAAPAYRTVAYAVAEAARIADSP